ncbi:hypothetical protein CYMTET_42076 [Cymbomonas tetramitiformis]|uniref:Uncharacterized protein n=1 Tax=Cymbomonas tetramitiformis TaxID=36881 RepID=A0AAE0C4T5_9CHLO|nr:hypothetical protein CYMTET_42076 [Cymbomonas tetramitiformis]
MKGCTGASVGEGVSDGVDQSKAKIKSTGASSLLLKTDEEVKDPAPLSCRAPSSRGRKSAPRRASEAVDEKPIVKAKVVVPRKPREPEPVTILHVRPIASPMTHGDWPGLALTECVAQAWLTLRAKDADWMLAVAWAVEDPGQMLTSVMSRARLIYWLMLTVRDVEPARGVMLWTSVMLRPGPMLTAWRLTVRDAKRQA